MANSISALYSSITGEMDKISDTDINSVIAVMALLQTKILNFDEIQHTLAVNSITRDELQSMLEKLNHLKDAFKTITNNNLKNIFYTNDQLERCMLHVWPLVFYKNTSILHYNSFEIISDKDTFLDTINLINYIAEHKRYGCFIRVHCRIIELKEIPELFEKFKLNSQCSHDIRPFISFLFKYNDFDIQYIISDTKFENSDILSYARNYQLIYSK